MTLSRAVQIIGAVVTLSGAVGAVVGCGLTDAEVTERCDREQTEHGPGTCFTDESYDSCVAAFDDCSDARIDDSTCPLTYSCE